MGRVEKAFDTCGIKLWELFEVMILNKADASLKHMEALRS